VCIYLGAMNTAPNSTPGQSSSQLTDEILDKRETAKRIRKSVRTVDAWMKARKLPYIKVGRAVLFRWSAILERLDSFRVN
jgi:predicted DNA-binding transcriptional regulator AlpA